MASKNVIEIKVNTISLLDSYYNSDFDSDADPNLFNGLKYKVDFKISINMIDSTIGVILNYSLLLNDIEINRFKSYNLFGIRNIENHVSIKDGKTIFITKVDQYLMELATSHSRGMHAVEIQKFKQPIYLPFLDVENHPCVIE